jgi:dipeptidase
VDVVTDLASRYGQGSPDGRLDPAFLIADGREAFAVEMFGPYWASQHVGEVRAVSDVCHLRQDWDHLSHGLADWAIARGWWPADGSKLDFAGVVAEEDEANAAALRRWGRATLLLEQCNGQIDLRAVRQVLSDHFDEDLAVAPSKLLRAKEHEGQTSVQTLCQHAIAPFVSRTTASLITQVGPRQALPIAWYNFGQPCAGVYFPLFPIGELPAGYRRVADKVGERSRETLSQSAQRATLAGLQERFDRETREFVNEAAELSQRGEAHALPRLAELFMQHHLETWENVYLEESPVRARDTLVRTESEYDHAGTWIG